MARTATDWQGRFRFATLAVGPYEISVRHGGFQEASRRLTTTASSAYDVPITLAVAGISTSVDVSTQLSVLDTARSQVASTVPRQEIDRSPMNGRQFLDLALLVPVCRRPMLRARSSSSRPRRSLAVDCRSAATATSPTTSSSTACRRTTTLRA